MSGLEAIWLGLVQGVTEFFPVSSSGHLVLFQTLLGIRGEGGLLFEIGVHVATLVAIVVFYRQRIAELIRGTVSLDPESLLYVAQLGVATLPAVAVGLLAKDVVEEVFVSPGWVAGALVLTGFILWTTRWTVSRAHALHPTWVLAIGVGLAQALAIAPGISRSGTTVAAALALGLAPRAAAEFSFLLGTVAISGAAVLMLPDLAGASSAQLGNLALGSAAALLSGLVAIWAFVRMLDRQAFYLFAWYAWAVGLAFGVYLWLQPGVA
jgi:undecaprenyl-diphosphatase